jgi:hypothetical protein
VLLLYGRQQIDVRALRNGLNLLGGFVTAAMIVVADQLVKLFGS